MGKLKFVKSRQENYNVRTFWFQPDVKLDYTAGQFIELFLPHVSADNRGIKRWFTLSSSPTDELISITTKFAGDKASSFKRQLFELKPGEELKFVEPMGDFVLPKDTAIPLLFVAGGIGLTPYHSMVKWLTDTGEMRQIQLLLAFNQPKDIIFQKLFEAYGAEVKIMVSNPDDKWIGEIGQLSADKIQELTGGFEGKRIYVSGPEPMVEALETDLLNHQVDKNQLVLDFFPGYRPDLT
ncbi:MAG: ferredoxin--NADP reductase [Candidatus Saccharimonadales bacterium]